MLASYYTNGNPTLWYYIKRITIQRTQHKNKYIAQRTKMLIVIRWMGEKYDGLRACWVPEKKILYLLIFPPIFFLLVFCIFLKYLLLPWFFCFGFYTFFDFGNIFKDRSENNNFGRFSAIFTAYLFGR